ncbi:endonuclease/exonuclease/phosphatase family protein [Streptomyces sp. NPDC059894]|uniref:endonuclease/exonuclease/phosphatase family protein n=1 Tax=unclassified Streptomyces TaxID=2593676 RepID=UPI00365E910F
MSDADVRRPQQSRRWVSLGLLIGGHTWGDEPQPLVYVPRCNPAPRPAPRHDDADQRHAEVMRAAGYESDHVLVHGLQVHSYRTHDTVGAREASDHLPTVLDVESGPTP